MEHLIDLMIELLTHRQTYLSKHVYKTALPSRGRPSFNSLIVITNLSQANQPLSEPQTHHISVRIHSSVFTPPTQGNTIRVQLHCFPGSEDIHYISYQHSHFSPTRRHELPMQCWRVTDARRDISAHSYARFTQQPRATRVPRFKAPRSRVNSRGEIRRVDQPL